ncbi:CDP-diacylglycerol--serine O-phosphatidyltransferase [Paracoccaceae bacterium Fryx2]|nr:CDP-diacylglycerol--serine O-phosphatidyltransferase [Paracoccaceae bacterium Fryx2]
MIERPKDTLPLLLFLPNVITILGLCAGLTAIRFIMVGRFDFAVMLIIFAAVIDGLDGLLARRLNAQSTIGAELDTLADFLSFGVAPALLVFQFALAGTYSTNWIFVLVYTICACLRLARFNVHRDAPQPVGKPHFIGVPAPGGALLALLPVFLTLQGTLDATNFPMAYGVYLGLVGVLMTSRVPTLSSKAVRVPRDKSKLVLIGAAIFMGLLVTRFWLLMVLVGIAYMCVILWNVFNYLRGRPI